MSTKELKPVNEMTSQEFRQQIAGLASYDAETDPQEYHDMAVTIAVMLARHYNRQTLDPIKLWKRIETALKSGVVKAQGPKAIVSAMLGHVKADPANVARDSAVLSIIEDMESKDKQWIQNFAEFVRTTIYAVMVYAREEWQQQKKNRYGRDSVEDEAAARESGEWHSDFYDEAEVRQCMIERAKKRGDESPDGMTVAEHLFGTEDNIND